VKVPFVASALASGSPSGQQTNKKDHKDNREDNKTATIKCVSSAETEWGRLFLVGGGLDFCLNVAFFDKQSNI